MHFGCFFFFLLNNKIPVVERAVIRSLIEKVKLFYPFFFLSKINGISVFIFFSEKKKIESSSTHLFIDG